MSIKVRATAQGYSGKFRQVGDVFVVATEKDLGTWMERVDIPKVGPRTASGKPAPSPDDPLL